MVKQSSVDKDDRKERQGVGRWRRQKKTRTGEEKSNGNYVTTKRD